MTARLSTILILIARMKVNDKMLCFSDVMLVSIIKPTYGYSNNSNVKHHLDLDLYFIVDSYNYQLFSLRSITHIWLTLTISIFTPPRNRGGVIFSLQFVCVYVCLCVCLSVCVFVCVCVSDVFKKQNSSRTDEPIWTRFSLNGCLSHWLEPYWNWWPWVKGQGHSDSISIFSS